uniref:Ribosomal_S10 domain-containing protein n=1 Tax=Panagrellus redivivus TaxID=6233 RepID=A0A7E4ZX02_PANRE
MLKQGDVFRVCKILYLDCQRPRKYQETLELICGSYTKLEICGSYPWRLLIGLIRPKVSTVEMGSGIKLAKNEVDVFVNQLFTKMSNQSLDVHVTGKKMVKLLPRLKIMARAFMHQRRRDGLKVAYIKIDFTHRAISSHLIEG